MKECENEYLGYCLTCGLPCEEVVLCSETIVCTPKGAKIDPFFFKKSFKERYEIIERKRTELDKKETS